MKYLSALIAALFAIAGLSTPAQADTSNIEGAVSGTVSLTVADVQYTSTSDCVTADVTAEIWADDDLSYVDYYALGTYDGPTTWPDYFDTYGEWSQVIWEDFEFCPEYDEPGNYTGQFGVTFYDENYNEIAWAYVEDAFTVRGWTPPTKATSKVTASKARYGAHYWKVTGTLTRAGHAYAERKIRLQRKTSSGWVNTVKYCYTRSTGKCAVKVRPSRAAYYRWKFNGNSTTKPDVSNAVRLTRR